MDYSSPKSKPENKIPHNEQVYWSKIYMSNFKENDKEKNLNKIINLAKNKSKQINKCKYLSNLLLRSILQKQLLKALLIELHERRNNLRSVSCFRPISRTIN